MFHSLKINSKTVSFAYKGENFIVFFLQLIATAVNWEISENFVWNIKETALLNF